MTSEQTRKVVEATEKDFQEKKQEAVKEKIKEIVTEYLKRIDNLDTKIDELQEEKKQLKLTLEDLKTGKLDVLKERLEKDPRAKKINVIEIIELHQHNHTHLNPLYQPWEIHYHPVPMPAYPQPTLYCEGYNLDTNTSIGILNGGGNTVGLSFNASSADCKNYTVGTYLINSSTVNFR